VLSHFNSTASIVTGNWQRVDDFGFERPASPTIFEYYRKQRKARRRLGDLHEQELSVHGRHVLGQLRSAVWRKRSSAEAAFAGSSGERSEKKEGLGVADRERVLRQLESILNEGYEGIGWTIFKAGPRIGPDNPGHVDTKPAGIHQRTGSALLGR
jgi:hypothetical protein